MTGSPLQKKVMYGYAIILPSEKWVPKRVDFKEDASKGIRRFKLNHFSSFEWRRKSTVRSLRLLRDN